MSSIESLDTLRGALWSYACYASRGNPFDADDLVQDVFIRYLREVESGVVIENLRHWLFVTAKHLAIDRGKRRNRRARVVLGCELTKEMASAIPDPSLLLEEQLLREERDRRIRETFATLTPLQRQCIELRAKGLLLREIAEQIGSRPNRVAEALARAVPHLQRALDLPVTPVHQSPQRMKKAA